MRAFRADASWQDARIEPFVLRSPRVTLSIPTEADAERIADACSDPAIAESTTVPSPWTRGFFTSRGYWHVPERRAELLPSYLGMPLTEARSNTSARTAVDASEPPLNPGRNKAASVRGWDRALSAGGGRATG